MKRRQAHKVPSFTIFEVIVVVAIMSVLISIITITINRFNEQLKLTSDLSQELNSWYAFRANLWQELYFSDSIILDQGVCSIYKQGSPVHYKINDDQLFRATDNNWIQSGYEMESIKKSAKNDQDFIEFRFIWKSEIMTLSYPIKPTIKNSIDRYFGQIKND